MIWLELLVMNHEIMGSSLEFTNLFLIFLKKRGGREKKKGGGIGGRSDGRERGTTGGRGGAGGRGGTGGEECGKEGGAGGREERWEGRRWGRMGGGRGCRIVILREECISSV
jgi:hypothetical protein